MNDGVGLGGQGFACLTDGQQLQTRESRFTTHSDTVHAYVNLLLLLLLKLYRFTTISCTRHKSRIVYNIND